MANDDKAEDTFNPSEGMAAETAALEITSSVSAVLSAAIVGTSGPARTLVALRIASNAARDALIRTGALSAEDAARAEGFADRSHARDNTATAVALAEQILDVSTTHATCSPEQLSVTLREAQSCLEMLMSRGNEHPVTLLVILYAAREFATALLKEQNPDNYLSLIAMSRAMENAIRPERIEITRIPTGHMSKGGDA